MITPLYGSTRKRPIDLYHDAFGTTARGCNLWESEEGQRLAGVIFGEDPETDYRLLYVRSFAYELSDDLFGRIVTGLRSSLLAGRPSPAAYSNGGSA